MSNPTQTKGFKPVQTIGNAPFAGNVSAYKIASGYAANIGLYDMVILTATGYINIAAAGSRVLGVCLGVSYVDSAGIPQVKNNWTSGTVTFGAQDATIFVADDPGLIVEGRFTATSLVGTASIGNTFPLVAGAPDTNGISTAGVDSTTLTSTAIQTFRFLGFAPKADNDTAATSAIGRFAVMNHEFKATTGV